MAVNLTLRGKGSIVQVLHSGKVLGTVIKPAMSTRWFISGDRAKVPYLTKLAAAEALAKLKGVSDGSS
jgi:hypothetical protein